MFQVKVFDQIIGFSTVAASLKNAWNPKQTTDIFMGTAWLHIVTQEFYNSSFNGWNAVIFVSFVPVSCVKQACDKTALSISYWKLSHCI